MDRPLTGVLLLIGTVVVVLNGYLVLVLYGPGSYRGGPPSVSAPDAFPLVVVPILAFAGSVFGLWRMWVAMRQGR
jgi:hypothetical protein